VLQFNKLPSFVPAASLRTSQSAAVPARPWRCRTFSYPFTSPIEPKPPEGVGNDVIREAPPLRASDPQLAEETRAEEVDPLYLFACHVEWERSEEAGAGWELISAARSAHGDTRAHARALLTSSHHVGGIGSSSVSDLLLSKKRKDAAENNMKAPYGLEITDDCTECAHTNPSFFCGLSHPALQALTQVSHKSILPAGAILFVEGQAPRGMFIICSGKVNLSATSREGKILILKTAVAGEALGLSATISGMGYETTAETASPCQLNFVDRKHFLELMQAHSETAVHAAQCLSQEYRTAYRDIHDLVLTRSSAGKLARLLLSQSPTGEPETETRVHTPMTHEEMAQRIGASRETVTRLLSTLRKKHLIRLDGPTLVIRDRLGLEALAV
jgi:CRP/FNR family transcriptional regulator, cyclic AMP receptor protein